jgi:hypothetical protein
MLLILANYVCTIKKETKIGGPTIVLYGLRESAAERFGCFTKKGGRETLKKLPEEVTEEPRRKWTKTTVFPLHGIYY